MEYINLLKQLRYLLGATKGLYFSMKTFKSTYAHLAATIKVDGYGNPNEEDYGRIFNAEWDSLFFGVSSTMVENGLEALIENGEVEQCLWSAKTDPIHHIYILTPEGHEKREEDKIEDIIGKKVSEDIISSVIAWNAMHCRVTVAWHYLLELSSRLQQTSEEIITPPLPAKPEGPLQEVAGDYEHLKNKLPGRLEQLGVTSLTLPRKQELPLDLRSFTQFNFGDPGKFFPELAGFYDEYSGRKKTYRRPERNGEYGMHFTFNPGIGRQVYQYLFPQPGEIQGLINGFKDMTAETMATNGLGFLAVRKEYPLHLEDGRRLKKLLDNKREAFAKLYDSNPEYFDDARRKAKRYLKVLRDYSAFAEWRYQRSLAVVNHLTEYHGKGEDRIELRLEVRDTGALEGPRRYLVIDPKSPFLEWFKDYCEDKGRPGLGYHLGVFSHLHHLIQPTESAMIIANHKKEQFLNEEIAFVRQNVPTSG